MRPDSRRLLWALLLSILLGLGCGRLHAQAFQELDLGFDASSFVSSLSTVDVDNDGDLDLFLTGWLVRNGTNYPALLGRNLGNGTFSWTTLNSSGDTFPQPDWVNSSASWLDYNHDGRLDLCVVENGRLNIYRQDADGFVRLPPLTRPGGFGSLSWKDFNQDGWVDALSGGSQVLRQEGELNFAALPPAPSPGLYYNDWMDFDADGRPDLLMGSTFYSQSSNSFLPATNLLDNTFAKAVCDCDADGAEDVVGFSGNTIILSVNSGTGLFTRKAAGEALFGDVAWGDFDNDGYNDLCIARQGAGAVPAHLHLNDGSPGFPATNTVLSMQVFGSLKVGDFDGDGKLDLIAPGMSYQSGPRLILNRFPGSNAAPTAPASLQAVPFPDDRVQLSWSRGTDDHTPAAALTYEVRIGTQPGTADVFAPVSNPSTGYRRLPQPGTAGARTNLLVNHLPPGTYYWSVQAVDSALVSSPWAAEGSFVVSKPVLSSIPETHTPPGIPSRPIPFTLTSPQGPQALTVLAQADNSQLVPPGAIQIVGDGPARSLVITPTNSTGLAFIELVATDTNGFSDHVTFRLYVEAFTPAAVDTPFTGDWANNGPTVWADFDGDGLLDVATHGTDPGKRASTVLLRNMGNGQLSALTNVAYDLSWDTLLAEDFDHDNVPDLFFSGFAMGNSQGQWANLRCERIARGRPDFALEPEEVGLTRLWGYQTGGGACWLDIDRDGAADAVLWGNTATNRLAYLHEMLGFSLTPGSGFLAAPRVLLDYTPSSVAWSDFSGDGIPDLLATYRDPMGFDHTYAYVNAGTGALTNVTVGLPGARGHLSVADVDNDGRPDFLLLEKVPRLFRNLGNNTFAEITNNLPQTAWSTALWGDLDNDGRSDVVLTAGGYVAAFRNLGDGLFAEWASTYPPFSTVTATLADVDNDGDLDLLLGGEDHYSGAQYLCRNNSVHSNSPPTAPAGLSVTRQPTGLVLHWNPATDPETPAAGLTYNVRVGTTPGGSQVVSALANPATGWRRVVAPGNAGYNLFLPLEYLPRGPLYWSVQAIDPTLAGGPFAPEQTYQFSPPLISSISNLTLAPNVPSAPVSFAVSDAQTPPQSLVFNVVSSNELLVPATNVTVSVSGTEGSLQITPAAHQSGSADLVLTVTDAQGEWVGVKFTVTVPEEFTPLGLGLPPLSRGAVAWGDADQDGDLDLLTSGFTALPFLAGSGRTDLWRNDHGVISTNPMVSLGDGGAGAVAFADVDRDGDLDVSFTGGLGVSRLFLQTSPGVFAPASASFTGATRSTLAWGDRDGDGDLDLVISGNLTNQLTSDSQTWLFTQNSGGYTRTTLRAPGLRDGTAEWVDVDNDGDNDLLITGSTTWYPSAAQTILYLNNNGVLTAVESGLPAVSDSALAIADFDCDGFPDVAISGRNFGTGLFRNDGTGHFVPSPPALPGYAFGGLAWGDYNGDGYPDLLISGVGPQDYRTELWFNDNGLLRPSGNHFGGNAARGAAWGDFDNDGNLDLALIGSPDDGYSPPRIPYFSDVFRNTLLLPPSRPPAPVGLTATVSGSDVILSWALPSGTPAGLSYNVRVGTAPFKGNLLSAPANPFTGQLQVAARGNAGWSGKWRLHNVPQGTYYWSVQAVDAAFRGSAFALESSFSLPSVQPVSPRFLGIAGSSGSQFSLNASGAPNRYVFLETSSDLQTWQFVATLQFDAQGKLAWTGDRQSEIQFFRLRQP